MSKSFRPHARNRKQSAEAGPMAQRMDLETLESRQLLAADLAVAFDTFQGAPAFLVPGDSVSLPIVVANQGDLPAVGRVTVNFYLSTDTAFDANDVLLQSFADQEVNLNSQNPTDSDTGSFTGTVAIPGIEPGNYFFLVRLLPNLAIGDLNQSNNVAASAEDQGFAWMFGDFNGRTNVTMSLQEANGTTVSFGLNGGGTGTVTRNQANPDRFDVSFDNTVGGSRATIAASGGSGTNAGVALINGIHIAGSLNSLDAQAGRLLGNVTVDGSISSVRFGQIEGPSAIVIGGQAANTAFEFGSVKNLTITTPGGVSSVAVTSWIDNDATPDTIAATWIGSLTSSGNFQAGLILAGRNSGRTLNTVSIGGTASKGAWDVNGRAGSWTFKAVAANWSASIKNNLISLDITNIFRGTIAAKTFSTITAGSLRGAKILAGADLGTDARLGGTDAAADTFSSGTVNSLTVNGKVLNSIVGAGLDPVDGVFKNGDDRLKTGRINNLVISKTASANSRFLAKRYPPTGTFRIGVRTIDTAEDRRFIFDDAQAPTTSNVVLSPEGVPASIRLKFRDNQRIDVATLGDGDLILSGPGGIMIPLTFVVPGTPLKDSGTVTVDYTIAVPGGTWDAADNGDYQILVADGQVKDILGNAVAAGSIASFTIAL